jgi:hypothetical protein
MTNSIDRLLSAHGRGDDDASRYRSIVTQTRPQMGFAITLANGDMEGLFYHNLDHLRFETRGKSEFLSFTHRATAVTIQGMGLKAVFQAIMRHTLAELNEPDGRPAKEGLPTIARVEITAAGQPGPAVRLAK